MIDNLYEKLLTKCDFREKLCIDSHTYICIVYIVGISLYCKYFFILQVFLYFVSIFNIVGICLYCISLYLSISLHCMHFYTIGTFYIVGISLYFRYFFIL
jgi:hypothetical protein